MQRLAGILSRFAGALCALAFTALIQTPAAAQSRTAEGARFPQIVILAYHQVEDEAGKPLQVVSPDFLRDQIRDCRAQGWTFMSVAEVMAAREHPEKLPPRVMVLTFDDGYASFLEQSLPVLRAEKVRATLAPITSYVGHEHAELGDLLSWEQLRAIDKAGDVDLASHSHALHQFEMNDPQRDTAPSAVTRRYLSESRRYEDREEYRSRLWSDFTESQRTLTRELGHPVSVLVWPYGQHNDMARDQARVAGFTTTLSLDARFVTRDDLAKACLPRIMVTRRMDFSDPALSWMHEDQGPVRACEVDLEALWDPDETVFRSRLDLAVTRARAMGATEVILPFAPDARRDGQIRRAYAMNHQMPLLADVWTMAASKFSVAQMRVWLRVPTLNQTWTWERRPEWRLAASSGTPLAERWTTRMSPEVPAVRSAAADLLSDLAVYLPLSGIVFDDDLAIGIHEGLATDTTRSAASRITALRALAEECKQAVRAWRPLCRFARVIPASAVERVGVDPASSTDLDECFRSGDLVIIEDGTPFMDRTPASFERIARRATARWRKSGGSGPPPVMAMVPARASTGAWLPAARQQALATAALRGGLVHLGSSPVEALGELPLGLLDPRPTVSRVRAASKRR